MKAPANCRLIGRWRMVESDLWDRAHLDLSGPATLTITAQGGEIAFGALEAGLEVEYARDSIGFHWAGCEEGDEVEGEGTAELLDDGTIEIEFAYPNGDEGQNMGLQAVRIVVVEDLACGVLDRAVHSLGLAVGPRG